MNQEQLNDLKKQKEELIYLKEAELIELISKFDIKKLRKRLMKSKELIDIGEVIKYAVYGMVAVGGIWALWTTAKLFGG